MSELSVGKMFGGNCPARNVMYLYAFYSYVLHLSCYGLPYGVINHDNDDDIRGSSSGASECGLFADVSIRVLMICSLGRKLSRILIAVSYVITPISLSLSVRTAAYTCRLHRGQKYRAA